MNTREHEALLAQSRAELRALRAELAIREARLARFCAAVRASYARPQKANHRVRPSMPSPYDVQNRLDIEPPKGVTPVDSLGPASTTTSIPDWLANSVAQQINAMPDTFFNEYGTQIYRDKSGEFSYAPIQKGGRFSFDPHPIPKDAEVIAVVHNHPGAAALELAQKDPRSKTIESFLDLANRAGVFPSLPDFKYAGKANNYIIDTDGQMRLFDPSWRGRLGYK